MAWETRKRGGQYYYRSRKVGSRCVKEYVGPAPFGDIAARFDAANRSERDAAAASARRERETLAVLDAAVARVSTDTRRIVVEALTGRGFRQHHRGEWRRRREKRAKT